ncbi:uncharacterized protein LOC143188948 [Calliopsis andreniformis]|uniref:uncharacterized protein LOC143188948 n=1 Tax=Calliopsis andreniformis TaxID=337506 RepID=UPI003FCE06C8
MATSTAVSFHSAVDRIAEKRDCKVEMEMEILWICENRGGFFFPCRGTGLVQLGARAASSCRLTHFPRFLAMRWCNVPQHRRDPRGTRKQRTRGVQLRAEQACRWL